MPNIYTIAGEGWKKEEVFSTEGAMRDGVRRIANSYPDQLLELTFAPNRGGCINLGYGKASDLKDNLKSVKIKRKR
jgi:hypothetical protein